MEDDRISLLPEPILQNHILSLLSQKDAVQTCILSKSWRHLGPTRPNFEFCSESDFRGGSKEKFVSVVENTLQRYEEQKLHIQEFILKMPWPRHEDSDHDSESILLLNKWIPVVLMNKGLKTFNLRAFRFFLPSVVSQAQLLEELFLVGCELNKTIFNSTCEVQVLKFLRTLSLKFVRIEEETFEKIMSSCPLIQHLDLESCLRLSTVKVKKARNLKHFYCTDFNSDFNSIEIDDAPSLETICIKFCLNWFHLHNNWIFSRLKSLYLYYVHLPTELLKILSSNNCLEELELQDCFGFREFKILNRSIKRLIVSGCPIKAIVIDAANVIYFEYRSIYLPSVFSFATTSREWKSCIEVCGPSYLNPTLKLFEILKALSQSQISLDISDLILMNQNSACCGNSEPVVVECLCLKTHYSSSEVPTLLNNVFRICRPRYIGLSLHFNTPKNNERQLAESIWKTLVNKGGMWKCELPSALLNCVFRICRPSWFMEKKGETRQCDFWQQDLEETIIQVSEKNANEWHPVQVCALSNNEEIRFRLKWRDLS